MLCQRCNQREATIFLTTIVQNETKKQNFCVECAPAEFPAPGTISLAKLIEMLSTGDVKEIETSLIQNLHRPILNRLQENNPRYPLEAYEFVCEAFDRCINLRTDTGEDKKTQSVSAKKLLAMLREFAVEKFGRRARAELQSWKIHRTEDFGEIVFDLVKHGLFMMEREDYRKEFHNGFDFKTAFPEN